MNSSGTIKVKIPIKDRVVIKISNCSAVRVTSIVITREDAQLNFEEKMKNDSIVFSLKLNHLRTNSIEEVATIKKDDVKAKVMKKE